MNEYVTGYQFIGGLFGLVLSSLLYMLGGRSGKWKRRFLGSFILALTVNLLFLGQGQWSPYYLILWPSLAISFSMGYGVNE